MIKTNMVYDTSTRNKGIASPGVVEACGAGVINAKNVVNVVNANNNIIDATGYSVVSLSTNLLTDISIDGISFGEQASIDTKSCAKQVTIVNATAVNINLLDSSASASGSQKLILGGANQTLAPNQTAVLYHSAEGWRALAGSGGGGAPGKNGLGYDSFTSADTITPKTGSVNINVNKTPTTTAFAVGSRVRVSSRAATSDFFEGVITAFANSVLTVNVDLIINTNSHNDWNIAITGVPGSGGSTGGVKKIIVQPTATVTGSATDDGSGNVTLVLNAAGGGTPNAFTLDATALRGANVAVNALSNGSFTQIGAALFRNGAQSTILHDNLPFGAGSSVDLACVFKMVAATAGAKSFNLTYSVSGLTNNGTLTPLFNSTTPVSIPDSQAVNVNLFNQSAVAIPAQFDYLVISISIPSGLSSNYDVGILGKIITTFNVR